MCTILLSYQNLFKFEKKTTIIVSLKIKFAYETIYLQKVINNYFIKSRIKICINKHPPIYKTNTLLIDDTAM